MIPFALTFNLSPTENIVIRKPPVDSEVLKKRIFNQTRSSQFGLSIHLQHGQLFIGAPQHESSVVSQMQFNEPGEIFKFEFKANNCALYPVDSDGVEVLLSGAYNMVLKSNRTLGAAITGGSTGSLVACAPRLLLSYYNYTFTEVPKSLNDTLVYDMPGICYFAENTNELQPQKFNEIHLSRDRKEKLDELDSTKNSDMAECGFSVHIADNKTILIGCPGVSTWRGLVVRYDLLWKTLDVPQHSISYLKSYGTHSYFGYSVSSGYFQGIESNKNFYVASAPRAKHCTGQVEIFTFQQSKLRWQIVTVKRLQGYQMGAYFGYTLLTEDFNNDGFSDLAIAAPLYSKDGYHENGIVYILINNGNVNRISFKAPMNITSEYKLNGRFGTVLTKLGDINNDGFNDLAVSAPFEGNGVVYIYRGGPDGLSESPSQRLEALDKHQSPYENENQAMFGHGMSHGVDIDSNGNRDLAIGAPNTETVYVFKSYPVVKVKASMTVSKTELPISISADFDVIICASILTQKQRTTSKSRQIL